MPWIEGAALVAEAIGEGAAGAGAAGAGAGALGAGAAGAGAGSAGLLGGYGADLGAMYSPAAGYGADLASAYGMGGGYGADLASAYQGYGAGLGAGDVGGWGAGYDALMGDSLKNPGLWDQLKSGLGSITGKDMLYGGLGYMMLNNMLARRKYNPPGTAPTTYYNTAYLGKNKGFAPGVYESFYRPQGLPGYAAGGSVAQPYTEGLGANPYSQQASSMDPGTLQFTIDNASSPLMQAAAQHELFNRKSRQRTPVQKMAEGGIAHTYAAGGKFLRGPGDGVSDSIPAVIHGNKPQRAALADGEFVLPARIVSEIGNGSSEAGARKLYAMMDRIQKRRGHTVKNVAKDTQAEKLLPA